MILLELVLVGEFVLLFVAPRVVVVEGLRLLLRRDLLRLLEGRAVLRRRLLRCDDLRFFLQRLLGLVRRAHLEVALESVLEEGAPAVRTDLVDDLTRLRLLGALHIHVLVVPLSIRAQHVVRHKLIVLV